MLSKGRLQEILEQVPKDVKIVSKHDIFVDGDASVVWNKDHDVAIYIKESNRLIFMDRDDYQRYKQLLRQDTNT